jgi:hypothetical protein
MGSLTPLLLLLLAVGGLEARGYFASIPKDEAQNDDDGGKITSKLAMKSKARELKENMNEINKLENSVESSPLLAGGLDPLLTNTADMDVTQQILVQLRELSEQLAALRRSVSNLKYQGHAHYKYMRRVQAACDAATATGTGGVGHGTQPATHHVVGDEQSNMIRTGT